MPSPLFTRDGEVAICRGCRRAYEGTISFAVAHARECQHQRLYDALYRLESNIGRRSHACYNQSYDCAERAEVVFAILGEP